MYYMVKIDKAFYKRISKIGLKNRWDKEHSKVLIKENLTKEKRGIHAYYAETDEFPQEKIKKVNILLIMI